MGIEYIGKCLLVKEKGERILVVGDLHFGFEEALNNSGVFVVRKMFEEVKKEFSEIFERIRGEELLANVNNNIKGKNKKLLSNVRKVMSSDIKVGSNINGFIDNNGCGGDNDNVVDDEICGGVGDKKVLDKIVLLGDVKHEFGRVSSQEWKEILALVDYLRGNCNELIVVKGNHDIMLAGVLGKREIKLEKLFVFREYAFLHGDEDFLEIWNKKVKTIIVGHAHPAVKIGDKVRREKYKCFLEGKFRGKKMIIVPSFFDINEGSDLREYDSGLAWKIDFGKFGVWIVGEKLEVLNFGKLGKLD